MSPNSMQLITRPAKHRITPLASFPKLWRAMVLMLLLGLGGVQPSWAISSGCADIQAYWSGGVTLSGGTEVYLDNHVVTAGEQITYQVTTSGSTNASNDPNSGAGFALYKNGGLIDPDDIIFEQYTYVGNELNLSGTYTVPADDANFVVYLWSGTSNATATASVKRLRDVAPSSKRR